MKYNLKTIFYSFKPYMNTIQKCYYSPHTLVPPSDGLIDNSLSDDR